MNMYRCVSVNDLIGRRLAKSLGINKLAYTYIVPRYKRYAMVTRNANIDAYYFVLIQKGHAVVEIDMREDVADDGDLLLLTPFSVVDLKVMSDKFLAVCLFVDRGLFERIPNFTRFHGLLNRTGTHKLMLRGPSFAAVENTFGTFISYIGRKHTYQEGLTLVLLDFMLLQCSDELCKLLESASLHVERKNELLQSFFSLLADHHMEHHDIGFYAGELNISSAYLSRIVRQTTKKTAYYYIADKLFASARHMLACTDFTIAEIADRLNFSDQSAFGKFFKARTGLSPVRYRTRLGRRSQAAT